MKQAFFCKAVSILEGSQSKYEKPHVWNSALMKHCLDWFKYLVLTLFNFLVFSFSQDPAGIFELVELVGNGTYGQVYKVRFM